MVIVGGVGVSYERGTPGRVHRGRGVHLLLLDGDGGPPDVLLRASTSLIKKRLPLGPYSKPMPRALWWS